MPPGDAEGEGRQRRKRRALTGPGRTSARTQKKTPRSANGCGGSVASLGRFELPAFRLGGERSILLSYRDVYQNYSIIPLKRIRTSYRLGGERSILLSYGNTFHVSHETMIL